MSSAAAPSPELVRHLDRAAKWRLLSLVLSYPDEAWPQRMKLLLECVRDTRLAGLGRDALCGSSPGLWMRVFGPAGPVRARAVAWEGGLQPGYLLAELSAYYREFGYEAPVDGPPDRLSVLCDFVAWLELKLAYACVRQDADALEVTQRALETFLKRFVAAVAWPVLRQLEPQGPEFLVTAAKLAAERSGPEPVWQAWPAGDQPEGDSWDDSSCAGPEGFVQLPGARLAKR